MPSDDTDPGADLDPLQQPPADLFHQGVHLHLGGDLAVAQGQVHLDDERARALAQDLVEGLVGLLLGALQGQAEGILEGREGRCDGFGRGAGQSQRDRPEHPVGLVGGQGAEAGPGADPATGLRSLALLPLERPPPLRRVGLAQGGQVGLQARDLAPGALEGEVGLQPLRGRFLVGVQRADGPKLGHCV